MTAATPVPAASPATAAAANGVKTRSFGRFELRKLLGRSAAAMSWLVFDPRTGQELMLTMPRTRPADAAALERWQHEVRMGARLSHPNIAPVLETGAHDSWPYVAVDRELGVTLTEWLADRDPPGAAEVSVWIGQALQGLAFAHEAGVSHGDLQLHSLVVSESGAVRVMALATSLESSAAPTSQQTLESTRMQAQRAAQRDVLAGGLLLQRLLCGQAPLDEEDTGLVIQRMSAPRHEIVRLPWSTPQPIDEAMRAIGNRATSTQERQRYLNARTLLRALDGWRAAQRADDGGPLALLLERLSSVGHLPALEGLTARVNGLALADSQRTDQIAAHLLQDMALSFELLRLVNSATVQGTQVAGTGPVLTVRRAVALLGIAGIRRAASTLRVWPGPLGENAAAAMERTLQRVQLAGHVAQMLRPPGYDPEVIYLVAALQNLGRLLVQYHFPDEAEQIWQLMRPSTPAAPVAGEPAPATVSAQPGMTEQAASYAVLGVDIEAIGAAVARHWGLGDEMQHMMRRMPSDRQLPASAGDAEMLLGTASCANDLVDAVTLLPSNKVNAAIVSIAQRFARALEVTPGDLQDALKAGRIALRAVQADPAVAVAPRPVFEDTSMTGSVGTGLVPLDVDPR